MAIASRQISRLKQQRQELKAQEQTLKSETETLKRETETLKRQEQKLKDLLSTIESRKQTTPQKEPSTLNSLLLSLKSQNMNKATENEFESSRIKYILSRHPEFEAILNKRIGNFFAREGTADAFRERVFELSEFNENAILSKRAQVVEEVNLHHQHHQHQVEFDIQHG
jgi:hypothetical protein